MQQLIMTVTDDNGNSLGITRELLDEINYAFAVAEQVAELSQEDEQDEADLICEALGEGWSPFRYEGDEGEVHFIAARGPARVELRSNDFLCTIKVEHEGRQVIFEETGDTPEDAYENAFEKFRILCASLSAAADALGEA